MDDHRINEENSLRGRSETGFAGSARGSCLWDSPDDQMQVIHDKSDLDLSGEARRSRRCTSEPGRSWRACGRPGSFPGPHLNPGPRIPKKTQLEALSDGRHGSSSEVSTSSLFHQQFLPVGGDPSSRPGHGLVEGMMFRGCEVRPLHVFVRLVIPKPILPWLEAADDRVTRRFRVRGRVLTG
jgi:hypothetical protein